jgi:hypothetical protein
MLWRTNEIKIISPVNKITKTGVKIPKYFEVVQIPGKLRKVCKRMVKMSPEEFLCSGLFWNLKVQ